MCRKYLHTNISVLQIYPRSNETVVWLLGMDGNITENLYNQTTTTIMAARQMLVTKVLSQTNT